jgi:hypothetical protein
MYVVEVLRNGGDVADTMGRMRSWLDDQQIVPSLFRLARLSFCLEFVTEADADAFAQAFDGHRMAVEPAEQMHRAVGRKMAPTGRRHLRRGATESRRKLADARLDTPFPSPASHG